MSIILPFDMKDRKASIENHCGETFREGDDYDGLALCIEIKNEEEAKLIQEALSAKNAELFVNI
ncbi:hypothetical protein [Sulfitobacter sp. R18_1]|uniref:hypothetical protein n=1 Tax=Sulfitobacter sp. R18_1 TaxID=2821104 RepID=UPI001AD9EE48|nr:hypothetical protein [Sulfitobacter sp. R18_1]MBO9428069.1 hypothetical protein [Sulfitobacter sp. R18_1]